MPNLVLLVAASFYCMVVGGFTASFACLVHDREATGEPVIAGRSHCACGRELSMIDLLPVLGWLRVRGVARCCGAAIPRHYPALEALSGALSLLLSFPILWQVVMAGHVAWWGGVPILVAFQGLLWSLIIVVCRARFPHQGNDA